jgi:hypothetical protein
MAETQQDFEVYAGSELAIDFTLVWEGGAAYDLTSSLVMWVLATKAGAVPLLTKAISSGISVVHAQGETNDPAVFRVTVDAEDTEAIEGLFYHEARVDGRPVASGMVTVLPSSTREVGS